MSDEDPGAETDLHDWSNAPIAWGNEPPAEGRIEEQVRDDIRRSLSGLPAPEELIYHVVQLTSDINGPSVFLCGGGPGEFYAIYEQETTWVTLSNWDDALLEEIED